MKPRPAHGSPRWPAWARLFALPAILLLPRCGSEEAAAPPKPGKDAGDYPLELPPAPQRRELYSAGRAAMLERLVSDLKLSGATSLASFHHIRQLFGRLPAEEAVPALEEALRRLLAGGPETRTILQNACEAAGYTKDPRLVPLLVQAAMLTTPGAGQEVNPGLQRAAMEAIGFCGRPDQAEELWAWFLGTGGRRAPDFRGRALLLRALASIEGGKVAPRFRLLLEEYQFRNYLRAEVLGRAAELPPGDVAPVLAPFFEEFQGQERIEVAEILHASGDVLGTNHLLKELEKARGAGQAALRARLVLALGKGPGPRWKQELLVYSEDPAAEVRMAVVESLAGATGEDVLATLEVMSEDPQELVRWAALKELCKQGRMAALDSRLDTLRTASGTPQSQALRDLMEASDPRLAVEAARRLPGLEGPQLAQWMQVLAHLPDPAGVEPLLGVLLAPRRMLTPDRDNVTYAAMVLSNLPCAAGPAMELYRGALKDDALRRPHILATLARISALPNLEPAAREQLKSFLLGVISDPEADPRDRVVLPRLMLHLIGLDEALQIKRVLGREKDAFVRDALSAFLWEFF